MIQVSIQMSVEEADRFYCATDESNLVLGQVEAVLELIALLIEEGDHASHQGIPAMTRLASRVMADVYNRYPDALFDLSRRLKDALPKGGIK